jgi:hypothetical protein
MKKKDKSGYYLKAEKPSQFVRDLLDTFGKGDGDENCVFLARRQASSEEAALCRMYPERPWTPKQLWGVPDIAW